MASQYLVTAANCPTSEESPVPTLLQLSALETLGESFEDVPGVWFFNDEVDAMGDDWSLRKSLSLWLERVPMFAGRISKRHGERLAVRVCNSGVPFEVIHSPPLRCNITDDASAANACRFAPRLKATEGSPLVCVRFVKFGKGNGCAIAATLLHCVSDAYTTFHFLKHWANVHRAMLSCAPPPVIDVCIDRSAQDSGVNPIVFSPLSPGKMLRQLTLFQGIALTARILWDLPWLGASYAVLSADDVDRMRRTASEGLPDGRRVSTNAAITSFLLRECFKVQGLAGDGQPCAAVTAINVRSRRKAVPTNYFGDAIVLHPHHFASAAEIQTSPLSTVASALYESYSSVDDATIAQEGAWVDAALREAGSCGRVFLNAELGRVCMFSNWTTFPVYDCDFGGGEPYAYVPIAPPFVNSFLIGPAPRLYGDGAIVIGMQNKSRTRNALRAAIAAALAT